MIAVAVAQPQDGIQACYTTKFHFKHLLCIAFVKILNKIRKYLRFENMIIPVT